MGNVMIADVMTASPESIDINQTVVDAQRAMSQRKIRHLPVMEDGKVVSIITDRDINLAVSANKDLQAAETMTVGDICALNLYQVEKGAQLEDVAQYMYDNTIGSVVVTEEGKLEGIFTATDACNYLAKSLRGKL